MKISGFTVVRNAVQYDYPIREAIQSILPICDEFVVNVGYSDDETLQLIESIENPKIKIFQTEWDMSMGAEVLSFQTNLALQRCEGDWAFYVQADELIHEDDLSYLKRVMEKYVSRPEIDALRFQWLHFFGSYNRYRVDYGWFQKQDRIIRNNGEIESFGDAYAFRRKDGRAMRSFKTQRMLYHYGWVHSGEIMTQRRENSALIGFGDIKESEKGKDYEFGQLGRFPVYFGSHPSVMQNRVKRHILTQEELKEINQKYWWHPARILHFRYKTGKRVKTRIE